MKVLLTKLIQMLTPEAYNKAAADAQKAQEIWEDIMAHFAEENIDPSAQLTILAHLSSSILHTLTENCGQIGNNDAEKALHAKATGWMANVLHEQLHGLYSKAKSLGNK